ncbi:MAG: hypothetical protein IJV07_02675 [Alphaproteobacteria bacterium]|nr:hypothetical protein [Alphaproteobacteria bacterium]
MVYSLVPCDKKKSDGGFWGFLRRLRGMRNNAVARQEIQSVKHFLPQEGVLRQMIDQFITKTKKPPRSLLFFKELSSTYSEAMQGVPVCVLVTTPKDAWALGLTRTVILKWPDFLFSTCPTTEVRINLDDNRIAEQQIAAMSRGYEIMRETEQWKAIAAPIQKGKIDLERGYLYGWKENLLTLTISPVSDKSKSSYHRLTQLKIPSLLEKMQQFYTAVELDQVKAKKYIGHEMYSAPEDYDHIRGWGHCTEYYGFTSREIIMRGRYFVDPGLVVHGTERNFRQLYPLREISVERPPRLVIPAPKNGERLIYKAEEKYLKYLPDLRLLGRE